LAKWLDFCSQKNKTSIEKQVFYKKKISFLNKSLGKKTFTENSNNFANVK
jgi:hypothetical protein